VSRLRSYMVTRLYQSVPLHRCSDATEVKSPFGDAIVHVLDCSLRPLRQTPPRRCAVVACLEISRRRPQQANAVDMSSHNSRWRV
jgi:hypothetical protein